MEGDRNTKSTILDLLGADRHAVDTPVLLVDLNILDANIARIAGTCRQHDIAWRPHTKGIKVPAIAHRLPVHLHEILYRVRGGRIEAIWPILGRGKLQ
jgi:hypothetical protein